MWWGYRPRRYGYGRGRGGFWMMPLFLFGMMMFFSRSFFFLLPALIVLGVLAFAVSSVVRPPMNNRSPWDSEDWDAEKRKHDFDDFEKPKHTPRYVQSDDGDMLEVIEEDKPKRDYRDDIDYV